MAPLVDIPRKALRGFRFGHTVPGAEGSAENALEGARGAFCGRGRYKPPDGTLEEMDLLPQGLGYDILPVDDK
jgi:hypothetical protein